MVFMITLPENEILRIEDEILEKLPLVLEHDPRFVTLRRDRCRKIPAPG
jgi:hypothetical protein